MDTITIEMLEQYGLKHKELSKELAQKVAAFQHETLEWQGKYESIKKELKDFIFKDKKETASVTAERGTTGKIIQLESKAAGGNGTGIAEGDAKMINIQGEVITPLLARTVMRDLYINVEKSWDQLIKSVEELKEKIVGASSPEKDLFKDIIKVFRTSYSFKAKAGESHEGKKQFEVFLKGMPIPIKTMAEHTYDLLEHSYKVLEEDYKKQELSAAYISALQTLFHSSFTLMNGVMVYAAQSITNQDEDTLKDIEDTIYQLSTFRNIMLDLINRKQQVFILDEQYTLVQSFNNMGMQAMLTLANGLNIPE